MFSKTYLAQCFEDVSVLVTLDTALMDDMVAAGDSGGDGTHGLSRNVVPSVTELVVDSVGDIGLSLS